jgi:hypothetical protein
MILIVSLVAVTSLMLLKPEVYLTNPICLDYWALIVFGDLISSLDVNGPA